ncbi:hypothetical protein [Deinococcus ruber]|uniref:Uncharacterized protein n=1 Tax=Deinococcus ruber TaxID=1848197 RepID=A0A918CN73_9DEIO|nr:hypothetical protein [Deinococcus ruber]GGR31773.1 hypothetical protein GCM10008957_47990 [Deinococcus ruber]
MTHTVLGSQASRIQVPNARLALALGQPVNVPLSTVTIAVATTAVNLSSDPLNQRYDNKLGVGRLDFAASLTSIVKEAAGVPLDTRFNPSVGVGAGRTLCRSGTACVNGPVLCYNRRMMRIIGSQT